MFDICYFCHKPLGSTYTYHWGNRCHSECVSMDEKDRRIAALRTELEQVKRERDVARASKASWKRISEEQTARAEAAERYAEPAGDQL